LCQFNAHVYISIEPIATNQNPQEQCYEPLASIFGDDDFALKKSAAPDMIRQLTMTDDAPIYHSTRLIKQHTLARHGLVKQRIYRQGCQIFIPYIFPTLGIPDDRPGDFPNIRYTREVARERSSSKW
jgi:hypothetical protein